MKTESQKILNKGDIVSGLFCIVAMIPGLIYYNRMPDMLPINFDINNQPNNYTSKPFVIFGLPLIMLAYHLLYCTLERKINSHTKPKPLKFITRLIIPLITIVIEFVTVMYVMDLFTDIGLVVCVLVGIIFIMLGNYLPKTRPNRTFKYKFLQTLNDEKLWFKTTRLAGWTLVLGGIIIIISAFLKTFYISIAAIIITELTPIIYLLIISKKSV